MPSRVSKLALSQANFSFISTQNSRGALAPDLDAAQRLPRTYFGSDDNYDYTTPQVCYIDNVMPVAEGWQSTSYSQIFDSPYTEGLTLAPTVGYRYCVEIHNSDPLDLAESVNNPVGPQLENIDVGYLMVSSDPVTPGNNTVNLWWRPPVNSGTTQWQPVQVWDYTNTYNYINTVLSGEFTRISVAIPNGFQFICIPGLDIIYFGKTNINNTPDKEIQSGVIEYPYTNSGIQLTACLGNAELAPYQFLRNVPCKKGEATCIIASQGYLIIAHKNIVSWALASGGLFDFAPFVNNAETGSDSRVPEELIGDITALAAIPGGFIIFSEQNAVAAYYSSTNFTSPFVFRKLSGCGGVRSLTSVSKYDDGNCIYAVTSVGLQRIGLSSVSEISPQFNDYLQGREFEYYDFGLDRLFQAKIHTGLHATCALIGSRYVCVSIGILNDYELDISFVYDIQLKRWGKLRFLHSCIIQLDASDTPQDLTVIELGLTTTVTSLGSATVASLVTTPNTSLTSTRQKIGAVTNTGEIHQLLQSPGEIGDDAAYSGTIIINGIQLLRERNMTLHTVELEGADGIPSLYLYPSHDGRTTGDVTSSDYWGLSSSAEGYTVFGGLVTAKNFTMRITGKFDLSTLLITHSTEGKL